MSKKQRPDKLSICLDDLKKHLSLCSSKSKNGKTYILFLSWRNDEKNQWGKDISVQVAGNDSNKDFKAYIGSGYRGDEVGYTAQSNSEDTSAPLGNQLVDDDLIF